MICDLSSRWLRLGLGSTMFFSIQRATNAGTLTLWNWFFEFGPLAQMSLAATPVGLLQEPIPRLSHPPVGLSGGSHGSGV
jgi:hypothetical protein